MRKVFDVFSEKISLICFGDAFSLFRENKRYDERVQIFFCEHPTFIARLRTSSSHQSLLLFCCCCEGRKFASSYKKREKKKNDERREENAPAVFQIQARAGDQLRVDEEW